MSVSWKELVRTSLQASSMTVDDHALYVLAGSSIWKVPKS
jgi:hypothetical protein